MCAMLRVCVIIRICTGAAAAAAAMVLEIKGLQAILPNGAIYIQYYTDAVLAVGNNNETLIRARVTESSLTLY